ncbi:MAG: hypothetical protein R3C14_26435 [Caldilineaceae bacterium]
MASKQTQPHFTCNLEATPKPFTPHWSHTVGSGHAPLALRADWQAQLRQSHHELGFRHVRFHGLLSDDMGTLICHKNELLYSFFNADQIVDFLLDIGMKPFMELSFMPTTLASGDKRVFNYAANVTPPADYGQWATLIRKLVRHWVDRYGLEEVQQWYFEVWNEPNLNSFWTGSQADYFKLYRYTVEAIKGIDPDLRVGGPATAKNEWIDAFVNYCEQHDTPADFITTHHYPTDAFGAEGDNTEEQLAKSHRSVLREQAVQAQQQAQGRPLYYTEWNSSSNPRDPLHDYPYAAAFIVKTNLEAIGLVKGYSFWTFSDIFAENYFPSQPFHGGFGLLNLYGIPKPTYRAYQLLHELGDELLEVQGAHATVDAWATHRPDRSTVLLTNFALPHHPIATEQVHLELTRAQVPQSIQIVRIDEDHANPRRLWEEMGKPNYLNAEQVAQLQQASELHHEPLTVEYRAGKVQLKVTMPPQAVAAVILK